MQDRTFDDAVSIQDVDLLARLTTYADHLEERIAQGQGWLIFNSSRERCARILRLLQTYLDGYRPFISHCHLPWRDFALHAYISTIALPRDAPQIETEAADSERKREFAIATGVANATAFQLQYADLLIISNLNPTTAHETLVLSQTVVERAANRRAVIALTAHDPWSLADAFKGAEPTGTTWQQFYGTMRRSGLIAH
ncbi:MAG TPA: hypothetical protein VIL85_01805 [Thermomicrobiales bacterium]|jgi:hypothetical protein